MKVAVDARRLAKRRVRRQGGTHTAEAAWPRPSQPDGLPAADPEIRVPLDCWQSPLGFQPASTVAILLVQFSVERQQFADVAVPVAVRHQPVGTDQAQRHGGRRRAVSWNRFSGRRVTTGSIGRPSSRTAGVLPGEVAFGVVNQPVAASVEVAVLEVAHQRAVRLGGVSSLAGHGENRLHSHPPPRHEHIVQSVEAEKRPAAERIDHADRSAGGLCLAAVSPVNGPC